MEQASSEVVIACVSRQSKSLATFEAALDIRDVPPESFTCEGGIDGSVEI